MPDKKEILKRLRRTFTQQGRLDNKFAKHDRFDKKYQGLYDKHEGIKAETLKKIDSGQITDESQLKGVNKQLQGIRDKMSKLEEKDLKLAGRTEKLMNRIEKRVKKKIDRKTSKGKYNYDDLDKA